MNASSKEVLDPASTELTTPEKITQKPTIAIETAATQTFREASVPRQTNAPPVRASASWACRRSRNEPPKSTSSSMENEPNAANVATAGSPISLSASANIAGITTAARPARRSAARSRSRSASHCRGCTSLPRG
jgi:hypothetical protein